MTGTTDKLRSLFLAALMVLSVVAVSVTFSGAAAAANGLNTSDQADSVRVADVAGSSIGSHFGGLNADSDDVIVEVKFNDTLATSQGGLSAGDIQLVDDDGTELETHDEVNVVSTSSNVMQVRFDNVNQDTYLDVSEVAFKSSADVTHSDGSTQTSGDNIDNQAVRLTTSGVVETEDANATTWTGERAAIISTSAGTTVEAYDDDGDFQQSLNTGTGSQIAIWNSQDKSGKWRFDFGPGNDDEWIQLRNLGVSAEAADTNVSTDEMISVEASANDAGRSMTATLYDSDDDEYATKSFTTDSDYANATVEFSVSEGDAGEYYVVVRDRPTRISVETDTINVSEGADTEAEFDSGTYSVDRGDVASFTVEMTSTDTATVTIGNYADDSYVSNVTVEDGDGDGEVTLYWNTFNSGAGDNTEFYAGDDDSVTDVAGPDSNTNAPSPATNVISASDYELAVTTGDDPSSESDDVSLVRVQSRSTDAITIWTAQSQTATDLSSPTDVASAAGDTLTQDDEIAAGDYVVVEVEASGLAGAMAAQNGDNATEDFFDLADSNVGNGEIFDLSMMEDEPQNNQAPKMLDLERDYSSVTVVDDTMKNDSIYVVVDAASIQDVNGDGVNPGEAYEAEFSINAEQHQGVYQYGLVPPNGDGEFENQSTSDVWSYEEATASVDPARGLVMLPSEDGVELTGTTSVAAGSELRVRLESKSGATSPFVVDGTATVQSDGTWSVSLDLAADTAEGDNFTIEVKQGTESLLSELRDGQIGAGSAETPTPTPTPDTPTPTQGPTPTQTPEPTDTPTATDTPEPTESDTETDGGSGPGFTVVLGVLALLGAALLAARRNA